MIGPKGPGTGCRLLVACSHTTAPRQASALADGALFSRLPLRQLDPNRCFPLTASVRLAGDAELLWEAFPDLPFLPLDPAPRIWRPLWMLLWRFSLHARGFCGAGVQPADITAASHAACFGCLATRATSLFPCATLKIQPRSLKDLEAVVGASGPCSASPNQAHPRRPCFEWLPVSAFAFEPAALCVPAAAMSLSYPAFARCGLPCGF